MSYLKNPDISAILRENLLSRFLRYVQIWTTSDTDSVGLKSPTTERQTEFLRLLREELLDLGLNDVNLFSESHLFARIPGNSPNSPCIGFMAHVDTSEDVSGEKVYPKIWTYTGEPLILNGDIRIDEKDNPSLARYIGETIITSDGSTLLGADDKSGVSVLMTLAWFLGQNPDFPRPDLELIFTTDEETGHGMDHFPVKEVKARVCYTVDGGEEGEIEGECFNAVLATVQFHGRMVHPGYGKGRLINALTMGARFISSLPLLESPEATEGREGNYWTHQFSGTIEESTIKVMLRDFETEGLNRRIEAVKLWAESVAAAFPGSRFSVKIDNLYYNMKTRMDESPEVMEILDKAVRETGLVPIRKPIRGGTDGARLTEMGIPCPNIFTGGHNFHSRQEWLALPALVNTGLTVLNILRLFANIR